MGFKKKQKKPIYTHRLELVLLRKEKKVENFKNQNY